MREAKEYETIELGQEKKEMTEAVEQKPIDPADLRKALTAMHHGLITMQARLDDHEKVLEKLIISLDNLAQAAAPQKGFRTPKS